MFAKKIPILYFAKNAVQFAVVETGSAPKVIKKQTFPWSRKEKILPILSKLSPHIQGKKTRILFSTDLSYTVTLSIPRSTKSSNERSVVMDQIAGMIPEPLDEKNWDFREISTDKKYKSIVAFAPVKSLFLELSRALEASHIKVDAMEPVLIAQKRHADPLIGLALKSDLKGDDAHVLNVIPQKGISSQSPIRKQRTNNQHHDDTHPKRRTKHWIYAAIILIGIGSVAFAIWYGMKSSEPTQPSEHTDAAVVDIETNAVPASPSQPSPTEALEEEIDLSQFSINVLNGSGIAGESTKIQDLLEEQNFTQIDTGNADNFNYQASQISMKASVPSQVRILIESTLSDYTFSEVEVLTDDFEYDVVITTGEPNET